MKTGLKIWVFGIASAALLLLYGCGGGGGGVTPVAPTTSVPVVTTSSVPVTVIDGAIQNATVCLDKNSNNSCDPGEPSGKTDVTGKVNLTVDNADVGKYPVIAVVGTDAIDADTGPVAVPFTLSAPADQVAVVSPLTTLVQQTVASTGVSTEEAAATVQAVTGINVSLFQDYTTVAAPTDGSISAATVARMVVVTTQQQSTAIDGAVGTLALDGSTITQADLDMAIQKKLLELLPALVAALNDAAVINATDMEAALLAAATKLVTDSGLNSTSIATVVAINNQTSSTTDTPSAGFTLRALNFTNTSNYFGLVFTASLAQNTPDANNNVRYVERRYRNNANNLAKWGAGSGSDPWRGADLHWSGNAWVNCPINSENTSSVRDAQGNSVYNLCDNAETGKANRATFDIAGKTLASVITDARAAGYKNLSIGNNSADTLSTWLGSATFPTGSSLFYQSSTSLTTAISYYPGSGNPAGVSNVVSQYSAAVSAGGDATTQGAGVACNSTEFQNTNGTSSTTLEGMISAMTGTPCSFGLPGSFVYQNVTYTNPDPVNEAWGNSTVGLGTIGSEPVGTGPAPGFYTRNTKLRMAFKGTGTNPVTYYACKERFNNGSTRNCTVIGTGSYTITTLGDARVLTLNNLPAQTAALNYTRVFVERGGLVYLGFQNKPGVFNSARLNTVAATALLTQLGLTPEDPSVPLALTTASYQGTWDFRDAANPGGDGITVIIGGNGIVSCREGSATITCSATITDPVTGAFTWIDSIDSNTATSTVTGNLNFLTGSVSGTFSDTISLPSTGNVVGHRR